MRRKVFEDTEHDVKVIVDLPEHLHEKLHKAKDIAEAFKKLVIYTIEKGQTQ